MVILFHAAKLQQLFDIRKYFCNYFYFYGDFFTKYVIMLFYRAQKNPRREMRLGLSSGRCYRPIRTKRFI